MQPKWDWQKINGWVALIWLAAIVAGYYVMHKPVSPTGALNLVMLIWCILVSGAIISISGGLGRLFLADLPLHPLEALSVQVGLGLGLLSLGILTVGLIGMIYPVVFLLAMLIITFFLRHQIFAWLKDWSNLGLVFKTSGKFGKTIAGIMLIILGFTLIDSLAPPIRFDALVYHLTLPKIYLISHRFEYIPQLVFWGMPQNAEMLYTMAISLAGESGALVLSWMVGLVALIGILGLLGERFGKNAAWVGVSTLTSGYTLISGLSWGYVDWWVILFSVGFLIMMWTWVGSGWNAHLGLSGIFAGLALGCKYTAGILLFCGAVVILIRFKSRMSQLFRALLWFEVPALMVFLPWLIKNYSATGNPFYPLIFPSGEMSPLRLLLYQGGYPWGNWLDVVFLPLRATLMGVEGAPGYSASIGPLFLGLGLAAGLGWSKRNAAEREIIRIALGISLTGLIIWMIVGRFSSYGLQSRLYLAIFPALAILACAGYLGFTRVIHHGIRFGRIAGFLVILVLVFNAFQVVMDTIERGTFEVVFGFSSQKKYLEDNLGLFEPAMSAIRDLPQKSRVLMLWETRSLYCLPECEPDETIDRWLRDRYSSLGVEPRTPGEILQNWQMVGYTHLLFHKAGAEFIHLNDVKNYNKKDWEALESILELLEPSKYFNNAYILYRIVP